MPDTNSFRFSNEYCSVKVDADKNGCASVGHGHGSAGTFKVSVLWGPNRVRVDIDGVDEPIIVERRPR